MGRDKVVPILIVDSRVVMSFDNHYLLQICCEKGHDVIFKCLLLRYFEIIFSQKRSQKSSSFNRGRRRPQSLLKMSSGTDRTLDSVFSTDVSVTSLEEDTLYSSDGRINVNMNVNVDPAELATLIETCFVLAARFGHYRILKVIASVETDPYRRGEGSKIETPFEIIIHKFVKSKALGWTCRHGHLKCLHYILRFPDVQPNHLNDHPLRLACLHGRVEVVKVLLSKRSVNPCSCDHICLQNAVICGYDEIVELLANDQRCEDHIIFVLRNKHLLNLACRFGRTKIAKFIFHQAYVNPGKDFESFSRNIEPVILTCCKYGRMEILQDILDNTTTTTQNNNNNNNNGNSSHERFNFNEMLVCSVRYGNIKIVRYLVNHYFDHLHPSIFEACDGLCRGFRRDRIHTFFVKKIPSMRKKYGCYYKTRIELTHQESSPSSSGKKRRRSCQSSSTSCCSSSSPRSGSRRRSRTRKNNNNSGSCDGCDDDGGGGDQKKGGKSVRKKEREEEEEKEKILEEEESGDSGSTIGRVVTSYNCSESSDEFSLEKFPRSGLSDIISDKELRNKKNGGGEIHGGSGGRNERKNHGRKSKRSIFVKGVSFLGKCMKL